MFAKIIPFKRTPLRLDDIHVYNIKNIEPNASIDNLKATEIKIESLK